MKICYQKAFFYKEDRLIYLSKIIQECQKYLHETIGLHGKQTDFFKGTLIPLNGLNQINNQCFVNRIPNNYLQNKDFRFVKIDVKFLIQ